MIRFNSNLDMESLRTGVPLKNQRCHPSFWWFVSMFSLSLSLRRTMTACLCSPFSSPLPQVLSSSQENLSFSLPAPLISLRKLRRVPCELMAKATATSKLALFVASCSISLNLFFVMKLYLWGSVSRSSGQDSLGWSRLAAEEAEVAASVDCSGHGRAYLDGFLVDGKHVCECNLCYGGPDCSEFSPGCPANADGWANIPTWKPLHTWFRIVRAFFYTIIVKIPLMMGRVMVHTSSFTSWANPLSWQMDQQLESYAI